MYSDLLVVIIDYGQSFLGDKSDYLEIFTNERLFKNLVVGRHPFLMLGSTIVNPNIELQIDYDNCNRQLDRTIETTSWIDEQIYNSKICFILYDEVYYQDY